MNVHLRHYVEAAKKLGIKVDILHPMLWARFEDNGKHWFILNTAIPLTNTPSTTIAKRKQLTNTVLKNAGIPVPAQHKLESVDEALELFEKYQEIVLKPHQGLGGKHITILPATQNEVINAYNEIIEAGKIPLLEQFIRGENYRILVVNGRVIDILRRLPATVIGDGEHTISELVEIENERRRNLEADSKPRQIVLDEHTLHALKLQKSGVEDNAGAEGFKGLTLETVPIMGQKIQLSLTSNLTQGGTVESAFDEANEYYKQLAIDAIDAIDLNFGGVDLITPSITEVLPKDQIAINEINYNPGIRLHYTLPVDQQKDVALEIMQEIRLFKRSL